MVSTEYAESTSAKLRQISDCRNHLRYGPRRRDLEGSREARYPPACSPSDVGLVALCSSVTPLTDSPMIQQRHRGIPHRFQGRSRGSREVGHRQRVRLDLPPSHSTSHSLTSLFRLPPTAVLRLVNPGRSKLHRRAARTPPPSVKISSPLRAPPSRPRSSLLTRTTLPSLLSALC